MPSQAVSSLCAAKVRAARVRTATIPLELGPGRLSVELNKDRDIVMHHRQRLSHQKEMITREEAKVVTLGAG